MKKFFEFFLAVLAGAMFALPTIVAAGITVHYEGHAKDARSVEAILAFARAEAAKRGWQVREASEKNVKLTRVVNEKEVVYNGPVNGIVVIPSTMCEPVHIQLDANGFMQDYVKTQFAGRSVHIDVIEFLRKLQPYFKSFIVDDEGEYWETRDTSKLQAHIDTVAALIRDMKLKTPNLKSAVTLPSGRIVDLLGDK